jgi:TPR repeat protein
LTAKKTSIYDFGFSYYAPCEINLTALHKAHDAGVGAAALYIGFQYYNKEEVDFEKALEWFKVAGLQKNSSAIAAHRWIAKIYSEGMGIAINHSLSFVHNEIYFILYLRFYPVPDDKKIDSNNANVRIYQRLKDRLLPHLSLSAQKELVLEANRFSERFTKIEEPPQISLPYFLKRYSSSNLSLDD